MKVQRVASPMMVKEVQTNTQVQADMRARAIAKMVPTQAVTPSTPIEAPQAPVTHAQDTPVANPNQVAPEELSAIKAPTAPTEELDAQGQNLTNSESSQAPTEDTKAEDPQLTARLQQLAKRERAARFKIQQQEQALKSKEDAIAAKEAELAAREKALDPNQYVSKQRLKQNTLDVMAENEISYDQVTEQYLQAPGKNPQTEAALNRLAEENKQLRASIDEIKNGQKSAEENQYNQAIKQIERDATKLISSNDSYELIRNSGEVKEVVKLIEQTFKEEGYIMSVQEAAELVEKELEDRTIKFFEKTNKLKQRLAPKPNPAQQASAATQVATEQKTSAQAQQTQPMKTLTNANSSTRQLSARERALLAFKGQLKP